MRGVGWGGVTVEVLISELKLCDSASVPPSSFEGAALIPAGSLPVLLICMNVTSRLLRNVEANNSRAILFSRPERNPQTPQLSLNLCSF